MYKRDSLSLSAKKKRDSLSHARDPVENEKTLP